MNVIDIVRANETRFRDNPAIHDVGESYLCTYGELFDRVDRLSQVLLNLGFRKGDVLLAWLPNVYRAIETELACLQVGGIWVTLHASLTWPEVEVVVESTQPRVVVTHPELFPKIDFRRFEQAVHDRLPEVIVTGETAGTRSYEELLAASEPQRPSVEVDDSDIARLRYTSGTTGNAKAAVLSHRVYVASLRNLQQELHPLDATDKALHAAPLTHASAALMYPIFAAGGTNVLLPRFDADAALRAIKQERITTMFCVPTMLHRLAASPLFQESDLSSLRTITYGGAAMPAGQLEPLLNPLGGKLVQIYGLTEALHPVTVLRRHEHVPGNPKLNTIGVATAVNEVTLLDEAGRAVPDGQVGELAVKGPNVMDGYWNDPEETAKVFRNGWLLTGDMAFGDADGYFTIVDRKKDVVISGGFNVYTTEVEAVLVQYPGVLEAAVFGLPHEDWGESVHAVVVTNDRNLSERNVIDYCRERLASYKSPKSVTIRGEPLPKSGSGKVLKPVLRRELESARA